jgi:hypothetical protein
VLGDAGDGESAGFWFFIKGECAAIHVEVLARNLEMRVEVGGLVLTSDGGQVRANFEK